MLSGVSLSPYRVEKGTAHFQVSQCDFDDLPGQVRDATTFLSLREAKVAELLAEPGASGVLDFAIEASNGQFRFAALPSELVRLAGSLGLAIEVSQYPTE